MILRRVAFTGATGFLGLHLLPALLRAGFSVRILARRDPAHPARDGLTFETVRGELADAAALAELVRDADLVVHAAGLIKARDRAAFLRANADGTAALAQAVRYRAPAARFVLVSSLAAREPALSGYAFSKYQAELAAQAAFADAAGQLAIIRPPAIYGPWDRATLGLFQGTLGRFILVPGHGHAAVVHARDAADAIAALAQNWRPGIFALSDSRPEGYRMDTLLRAAALATGGTPRFVPVPDGVVLAAGSATSLWSRLTGQPQIFGAGKAREMMHPDWSVTPSERLPAEIFAPRIGLAEGFAETVAWYRQAGWL